MLNLPDSLAIRSKKWLVMLPVLMGLTCGVPARVAETAPVPAVPSASALAPSSTVSLSPEAATRAATSSPSSQAAGAGPAITDITTNLAEYPAGQVPAHEKLEISFQVDTTAQNLQMPYDPAPPAGVTPGIGISVNALFTPDNWATIYTQPAFYYQEFLDEIRSGKEWYYPTGNFAWKVRFSPPTAGAWQFKLTASDATGSSESAPQPFQTGPAGNPGFVRVSPNDPRYFEHENGAYFPGMGYNMNFNHVNWVNPVLDNTENFQVMNANGIQLARIWLSQWGIYGPSWNPWNSIDPNLHGGYIPYTGLAFQEAYPGSEVSMKIDANWNPCMFIGWIKAPPAVQQNTTYRVRIRYKLAQSDGPRIPGQPHGLVAKTGGWLWGGSNDCDDPGTGTLVTPHQSAITPGWEILEDTWNSGGNNFLPNFYLVMENVNAGLAYIDYVWIEADLGNGNYGPNIVSKPWMAHHLYIEQRNSYAFDKLLELAQEYGIYLRPVIHEKNEWIFNRIDYDGNFTTNNSNDNFYGNGRQMTKVRWLQQAWWRYLQARWGYSPQIHSWELLNEGDPTSTLHFIQADELGAFIRQFAPNHHLVSTSFWHSFPRSTFWANPDYPNVDFADLHLYIRQSDAVFNDAALASYEVSMQYGAQLPGGAGKPIIRGETGFVEDGSGPATDLFDQDTEAIWLHNFLWAGLNPGGMLESYWYETTHIYSPNQGNPNSFDHRPHFGSLSRFLQNIPLSNGDYQDAEAVVSNPDLRAWGQKDLVHQRAHLWLQNRNHTWANVINGVPIAPLSASIQITGFNPGGLYTVEWWDPYATDPGNQILQVEGATADGSGTISLQVSGLTTDVAVKIHTGHLLWLPVINAQ